MNNPTWFKMTFSRTSLCMSLLMTGCLLTQMGCITTATKSIPASRLPMELRGCEKEKMTKVNLAALRQRPQKDYTVGAGDILSIYVPGIIPANVEETPVLERSRSLNNIYYPPGGQVEGPAVGLPLQVDEYGALHLPLIDSMNVNGLSTPEIAERLTDVYREEGVLENDRVQTLVSLLKPRVHRVMVIRDDSPSPRAVYKTRQQVEASDRGFADLVDLPNFENDILHALSVTGGLPGTDAYNRIWIFRNREQASVENEIMQHDVITAVGDGNIEFLGQQYETVCIPLTVPCGQPLPFKPEDVVLETGDVVYLEARDNDFFYVGGLLPGGEYPLPRDRDVDVLEAIAISSGGVGSPAKGGAGAANLIRQGNGLGNIPIPPTRLIVVRKLADGQQVRIRVDLNLATQEATERILVQPGDLLMLHFTPGESVSNSMLNFFNFTFVPRFGT